jgi:serine/threonine protein phosphatase PrpC
MPWTSVKRVHQACEMNAMHRSSMEDEHRVIDKFLPEDETSAFFAVYDGHGGRGVVDFLKTGLERNIKDELGFERSLRGVEECLTSAFLLSDIETAKENLLLSGSTAAICLILSENGEKILYSANVGDTRAVLSEGGKAQRVTFDHKASEQEEIKRIEASGGFVRSKRVLGVLTVTRSFGDHTMKNLVLAKPYTSSVRLNSQHDVLLLACDGVWDVFSDQEAMDFVRQAIASGAHDVAAALVQQCIEKGTTDNVTALVIEL